MVTADFELNTGEMVGEYKVERKIGAGAFGKVYAAVHPVIGKKAAIKVLNPAQTTEEMVARFADEARAVNQIRHRHIVDIFSFGSLPNGLQYFVMELLEGMTLHSYLRKNGAIDPATAFSILWPVGRALSAAHKAGIAHRDLKPENIFLVMDQDGGVFPKLLDFGIAKLQSDADAAHRTRAGTVLGTPVYMSPEQCRATTVDHRADIYSFGIILHEVLTGRRPFEAENVMDVIMKQISDPPPRMSACLPSIPPALDAPILKMLEKAPGKRPQSIQAALDELAAAAKSVGIQSPVSSGPVSLGSAALAGAGVAAPVAAPSAAAPNTPPPGTSMNTAAWLQNQAGMPSSGDNPSLNTPPGAQQASMGGQMSGFAAGGAGGTHPSMSGVAPAMSAAIPSLVMDSQGNMVGSPVASGSFPGAAGQASMGGPISGSFPGAGQASMAGQASAGFGPGASQAGPHPGYPPSGPASGPHPQGGQVSTLLSAGMATPNPSMVQSGAMGPGQGYPPPYGGAPSVATPAAPSKSSLPIFLAIGAGLVVLVAILAFALGGGKSSSGGDSSGVAQAGEDPSGKPAKNGTVQIGSAPPKVGHTFEQEEEFSMQLDATVAGATLPMHTSTSKELKKYKINILAVNDWNATRAEIQYFDCYEVSKENKLPEKKKSKAVANRSFFAATQDGGPTVSAVDGNKVTDDQKDLVLSDVDDMLEPRPDVFRRPLAVGDSLSLPPAIAAQFVGLSDDDSADVNRVDKAELTLKSVDTAANSAAFDIRFTYIHEGVDGAAKVVFAAPIAGTITLDIPTGLAIAGKMTGPVEGTVTQSGIKVTLSGTITVELKGKVTH